MSGRNLVERFSAAEELDRLFFAPVDGVDELELLDAEVSDARASTNNSSTGVSIVSRPGLVNDTVGERSVVTSIVYCGEAATFSPCGPSSSMR
jgi:hypothetical protein